MNIKNNLHNIGCKLQEPCNWGVEQFTKTFEKKEGFLEQIKYVALRALKCLAGAFAIITCSLPYLAGMALKSIFKQSEEVIELLPKSRRKNPSPQNIYKAQNLNSRSQEDLLEMKSILEEKLEKSTSKNQKNANRKRLNKVNLAIEGKLPKQKKNEEVIVKENDVVQKDSLDHKKEGSSTNDAKGSESVYNGYKQYNMFELLNEVND